jgi:hypothetical protein
MATDMESSGDPTNGHVLHGGVEEAAFSMICSALLVKAPKARVKKWRFTEPLVGKIFNGKNFKAERDERMMPSQWQDIGLTVAMSAELYICELSALLGHVVDFERVVVGRWPLAGLTLSRLFGCQGAAPLLAALHPGGPAPWVRFVAPSNPHTCASSSIVSPGLHFALAWRSRPFSPCSRTASLNAACAKLDLFTLHL